MSKQKSSTPKSEHSPMLTKAIINNKTNENKTFTVKILKRENGGLGFLIRQRELQPYFSVWEIIKNGSAESCGKINKGDIILKVNNEDLTSVSYERGLEILKSIQPGCYVELTLQTLQSNDSINNNQLKSEKFNGFMSPLQKLKKKIIGCTSNNFQNSNILQRDENTSLKLSSSNRSSKLDINEPKISQNQDHLNDNVGYKRLNNHSSQQYSIKSPLISHKNNIQNLSENESLENQKINKASAKNSTLDDTLTNKINKTEIIPVDILENCNYSNVTELKNLKDKRDMQFDKYKFESLCEDRSKISDKKVSLSNVTKNLSLESDNLPKDLIFDNENKKNITLNSGNFNTIGHIRHHKISEKPIEKSLSNDSDFKKFDSEQYDLESISNNNEFATNHTEKLRSQTLYSLDKFSNYQNENDLSRSLEPCSKKNHKALKTNKYFNQQKTPNKNKIQIIQDGDDIRINIDGNIEILTNRVSDRKVISLSPQCARKLIKSHVKSEKNISSNDNTFNQKSKYFF